MQASKSKPRHAKVGEQKRPAKNQEGQPTRNASDDNMDAAFAGKEYGEGNYKATKQYDDATRDFVRSGKVGDAAKHAAPKDARQAKELAEAEAQGKGRSKGEDPALYRSKTRAPGR